MITETDKAWAAGILDFQGRIVQRNNRARAEGSVQISLQVDTSIRAISQRLSELTGTKPEPKEAPHRELSAEMIRRGCVEHCPEPHVHVDEGLGLPATVKWSVTGAAAAIVLWNIRPYMVTARQAEHDHGVERLPWDWALAMTLASTRLSGRGAKAAVDAIHRMADLGWDLPPLFRQAVNITEMATVHE